MLEGLRSVLDRNPIEGAKFRLEDCSVGEGGLVDGLAATDWDEIHRRMYEGRMIAIDTDRVGVYPPARRAAARDRDFSRFKGVHTSLIR